MKKADWILDYDMHTDSTYRRPGCPKCNAPCWTDGKCFSCGKQYRLDDEMVAWLEERNTEKVEMEDCLKFGKSGCGGKGTLEVHYHKNHVTGEWQAAYGHCTACGMRIIV